MPSLPVVCPCLQVREEAGELCQTLEANEGQERAASEMADLLYHAMVLLNVQVGGVDFVGCSFFFFALAPGSLLVACWRLCGLLLFHGAAQCAGGWVGMALDVLLVACLWLCGLLLGISSVLVSEVSSIRLSVDT